MIKRYVLFAGDDYYPSGGWGDFQGSFDTLDEAKDGARKADMLGKWSHIIDLQTGERCNIS